MERKIKLRPEMVRTIKRLNVDYAKLYGTPIPDFVFFEMIVFLGIETLEQMLMNKADSMKMEVMKK